MSQPSHTQYAIVTYLILLVILLVVVGMIFLVANNA